MPKRIMTAPEPRKSLPLLNHPVRKRTSLSRRSLFVTAASGARRATSTSATLPNPAKLEGDEKKVESKDELFEELRAIKSFHRSLMRLDASDVLITLELNPEVQKINFQVSNFFFMFIFLKSFVCFFFLRSLRGGCSLLPVSHINF